MTVITAGVSPKIKELCERTGAMLAVVILAIGCSVPPTPTPTTPTPAPAPSPQAALGKEFSLAIGQGVSIASDKLSVKFLDVTEDSRCPKGVTCIWAGQVSCVVEVILSGNTDQIKLTAMGGSTSMSPPVSGYAFAFNVEPYPEAGKPIAKGDYRLNLTITK